MNRTAYFKSAAPVAAPLSRVGHSADPATRTATADPNAPQLHQKIRPIGLSNSNAAIKLDNSGNGSLEGLASPFWEIDSYGEFTTPGCFKQFLPEFIEHGFLANTHMWDVDGMIGWVTKADETEQGLVVEFAFHSDSESQTVRQKMAERLAAKKRVSLSIGYYLIEWEDIPAKRYQEYAKANVPDAYREKWLADVAGWNMVRALKVVQNVETSVVPRPAAMGAAVGNVKSADGAVQTKVAEALAMAETKGALPEDLVRGALMESAYSTHWRTWWKIVDLLEDAVDEVEMATNIDEKYADAGAVIKKVWAALRAVDPDEDAAELAEKAREFTKAARELHAGDPSSSAFVDQLTSLRAGADAILERAKSIHSMRAKESRTLSKESREKLGAFADTNEDAGKALIAQAKQIRQWLEETDVKKGAEQSTPAGKEGAADEPAPADPAASTSTDEPTPTDPTPEGDDPTEKDADLLNDPDFASKMRARAFKRQIQLSRTRGS